MERQKVDYDVIGFLAKSLALRFKITNKNFTHVIGISRGGLLPAKVISYALDAKLLVLGLNSYDDSGQTDKMDIVQDIDFNKLPEDSRLLIVDDKIDTGNTIDYIKERIGNKFKLVRYVTLFAEKSAKDKVDHYGVLVPDETWIDFPWE